MQPDWLSNAYLVRDEEGGTGVVIDSGGPSEPLLEAAERHGLDVRMLLLTHHHADHVAENHVWKERHGVEILAHPLEAAAARRGPDDRAGRADRGRRPAHRAAAHPGPHRRDAQLRGHGSEVFTGDTLFKGSVGGVRAPGSTSFADLKHSIMDVLMELPHETVVRPGHTDPTTIGDEWEEQRLRARLARPRRGGRRAAARSATTRRRWCCGRPTTTAATRPGCAGTTAGTTSCPAAGRPRDPVTLAYGVLEGGGVCARLDERVVDLSGLDPALAQPSLNAFMAPGRSSGARRATVSTRAPRSSSRSWRCPSRWPTTSTSTPAPPRRERRPDLPGGGEGGAAELASPADRLPRAGGDRRCERHAGATAGGPALAWRLRSDTAARRRARGRLRDRDAEPPRRARCGRPCARARLRDAAAQRLVGARHPGVGDGPARSLPGQVVRDLDIALGGADVGARATCVCPPRRRIPSRCRTCASGPGPRDELELEINGTVVTRPDARHLYWSIAQQVAHLRPTAPACAPATCWARARSRDRSASSAAVCSSSPGTARSRSTCSTDRRARSSRTATRS